MVYTIDGTNFTRRSKVVVTGNSSGAQTDFQIKLTALWAAAMQADYDDVRFTKADMQTLIDAWLESKTDSTTADIWAEFPTTPADGVVNTEAYMYFGNTVVASDWDIGATFLFGDDFPGSSLDGGKWTTIVGSASVSSGECTLLRSGGTDVDIRTTAGVGADTAYRSRLKINSGVTFHQFGMSNRTTNINWHGCDDGSFFYKAGSTEGLWSYTSNETTYTRNANSAPDANYHTYDITRLSGECKFYKDEGLLQTHTTNIPDESCYGGGKVRVTDGTQLVMDWMLVRKYAANPPTAAFGTEEHQRRTPMMM